MRGRDREVVRGISLTVEQGSSYGLVGESGCGKSTVALSIVRYLPRNGRVVSGTLEVAGRDVLALRGEALRLYRRDVVSMVYQNPGAALNPDAARRSPGRGGVRAPEGEPQRGARAGDGGAPRGAHRRSRTRCSAAIPHQLSGGMQQRVVIAMALATDPSLLILDEPTTGLDATVEAEVIDLIAELQERHRTAVLFISHNLGLIRKACRTIGVLYAGELVEEGPTEQILHDPRHPYTVGLLRCIPRGGLRKDRGKLDTIPGFLPPIGADLPGCVFVHRCALAEEICHTREAGRPPARRRAPEPLSLPRARAVAPARHGLDPGREAGPRARRDAAARHRQPREDVQPGRPGHQGARRRLGDALAGRDARARRRVGQRQDDVRAHAARHRRVELGRGADRRPQPARQAHRPLRVGRRGAPDRLPESRLRPQPPAFRAAHAQADAREARQRDRARPPTTRADDARRTQVRLPERALSARPTSLSGGQKQRVAIARAFAGEPRLVICDEPTSALDVSVQAAILNLLVDLQESKETSYVFISHDLGVVRYLSDRIAVLYLGRLMELGPAETVFEPPHHPYTEALLSAVPTIDGAQRTRIELEGEIPSAADPPSGCVFHTRCPRFLGAICETEEPPLAEVEPGHLMRCHIPIEELRASQTSGEVPVRG